MGETLKTARLARGLTQDQLSELSGVHQTTISDIEIGRNLNPSWTNVVRLARALDVDPIDIFPVADRASA